MKKLTLFGLSVLFMAYGITMFSVRFDNHSLYLSIIATVSGVLLLITGCSIYLINKEVDIEVTPKMVKYLKTSEIIENISIIENKYTSYNDLSSDEADLYNELVTEYTKRIGEGV